MSSIQDCVPGQLGRPLRVPSSTYRLQMNKEFVFTQAAEITGYLHELGIGDLYLSPVFEARPGSMHGYDVTRHDRLNPELGGEEGFAALRQRLEGHSMGLLLDIVPNHMGVGNDTRWWQDVLENGRSSEFARYFDIDWNPLKPDLTNKLLLPVLGAQYGVELEARHIQLAFEEGRLYVRYYDHRFPVAPRTIPLIFAEQRNGERTLPESLPAELRELLRDLAHVPPHDTTDPALIAQRREQLAAILPRMKQIFAEPGVRPIIDQALERMNGREGEPASFDRLHELLEAQPYRLAYWRVSAEEINYRRFFDINDLVGLSMENPAVFAATHCLVRRMMASEQITGLRIDHCDGMFDPRQYLIRLQQLFLAAACNGPEPGGELDLTGIEKQVIEATARYNWTESRGPFYVVVEKILEPREYLPREWPVSGTSGYDFVYMANQVFIHPAHQRHFTEIYDRFLGRHLDPDDIIYRGKLQVMQTSLASEVYVLTNLLSHIAGSNRRARDFTDNILETVIRETIACFPVYRTYIDERGVYSDRDRAFIRYAISRARRLNPDIDSSAFYFLRDTLLLEKNESGASQELEARQLYFALKFQQLTGPVMAKGVEDTAFYVYNRFLSANEVGGSLKVFGISPAVLHASNQERLENAPHSMLASSTHDTKRSEDVRARLNVLSEIPTEWSSLVRRWQRYNARHKVRLEDGRTAPDENEEYLIYQTVAGAWPWRLEAGDLENYTGRLKTYLSKAISEAKVNLSWINPDPVYEQAVHAFLEAILRPEKGRESRFLHSLQGLMPKLRLYGAVNSLAQLVLKLTCPGVPDFYQGTELWELALVDPDNRRPVDYALRTRLLAEMRSRSDLPALVDELVGTLEDGRIKLWVTHRGLELRRRLPQLFLAGSYRPLEVSGTHEEHAVAFLRRAAGGERMLTVVPRLALTLMGGRQEWPAGKAWNAVAMTVPEESAGSYVNVFTGERVELAAGRIELGRIFSRLPVAILVDAPGL